MGGWGSLATQGPEKSTDISFTGDRPGVSCMVTQRFIRYTAAAEMELCYTLHEDIFIFKEKIGEKTFFQRGYKLRKLNVEIKVKSRGNKNLGKSQDFSLRN